MSCAVVICNLIARLKIQLSGLGLCPLRSTCPKMNGFGFVRFSYEQLLKGSTLYFLPLAENRAITFRSVSLKYPNGRLGIAFHDNSITFCYSVVLKGVDLLDGITFCSPHCVATSQRSQQLTDIDRQIGEDPDLYAALKWEDDRGKL